MILFRPVGLEELSLIYEAGMRAFPPRLPDQPIFYPVTNEGYAIQIARDWNTKSGTRAGFVTRFAVADEYIARFERRIVGAREHEELWVPAEELGELNSRIEGRIEVVGAFFGEAYRGQSREGAAPAGDPARAQLVALANKLRAGELDVAAELAAHAKAVFLDFFFWQEADVEADGIDAAARDALLDELRAAWTKHAPDGPALGLVR